MMSQSRCILVMGTGRSGTSAVAGALHKMGVNMGAEFNAADRTNPFGTFEDLELFQLTRAVLHEGASIEAFEPLIAERSGQPLWGWKDPGLTWIYPQIAHMLPEHKVIICHRAKDECVNSFMRAYNASHEVAEQWYNRNKAEIDRLMLDGHFRDTGYLSVGFQGLLDDPGRTIAELEQFVFDDLGETPGPFKRQAAIDHIRPRETVEQAQQATTPQARAFDGVAPMVGIPMERTIAHADTVYPWLVAIAQQSWAFIRTEYGRTDVQRNAMVEHVLENEQFTHLVMLDLDHDHPADIVFRLCQSVAENPERQVLSGLAFRRGPPFEPIAFQHDEDEGLYYAVTEWEPGEVLEVAQLSTSCCIISREVLERMTWPWFEYTYPERGKYPTEDIAFCKQLAEMGVKMYVDTRIRTVHLRTGHVDESVFRAYMEMEKQKLGLEEASPQEG